MATKEEKIALYRKVKELHTLLKKDFDYKNRSKGSKHATYSISATVWKRTNQNETGPGEKMERLFKNIIDAVGDTPIEGAWGLITDRIYDIAEGDYQTLIDLMAEKSSNDESSYQSANHETFLMLAAHFNRPLLVKDILASPKLTKFAFVNENNLERTSWGQESQNVEGYAQHSGNPEIITAINGAKARVLGAATVAPVLGRRATEDRPIVEQEVRYNVSNRDDDGSAHIDKKHKK
jgi:hypothetical protein